MRGHDGRGLLAIVAESPSAVALRTAVVLALKGFPVPNPLGVAGVVGMGRVVVAVP